MDDAATLDIHRRHRVRVEGTGPTLLYAHGFGCSQAMWDAILPAFAGSHRQVAFDYAGSGRSDRAAYDPKRHASLEGYADDLLAIARSVAPPEGLTLVAHSVSCSIGMLAAAREPALFRDLALLGPNPCFIDHPPDYIGGFQRADLEGLLTLMDQNYLGWAQTLAPVVAGEGGGAEVAGRLSESFCSTDPDVARQFAAATFFSDNRSDVGRVRTPALLLQHRHDALAPMDVGRWLKAQLPEATLEVLDVAGHCAHMSHPALVVVTDASGSLQTITGDVVEELGIEAGALDYIGTLFGRASAIFLETHLWPLLRRDGRFDECHVLLQSPGGTPWPCLVSARRPDDGARVLWLFFPARERARFEAELVAARQSAQGLARELAEANRRLEAQSEAIRTRNDELDQLSRTDPLTGLGNRRALDAAFMARPAAPQDGTPSTDSALLMVDADHFKAINDRWGHDVGDTVLVAMAGVLRTCLRRSDTVVRLGGEEFALWLPDASPEAAARVAETVHAKMAAMLLPDATQALTVSIGAAMLGGQRHRNDLALLLKRADEALYLAKSAGRHCTRRADALPHAD